MCSPVLVQHTEENFGEEKRIKLSTLDFHLSTHSGYQLSTIDHQPLPYASSPGISEQLFACPSARFIVG
jgi:hypothetical protein